MDRELIITLVCYSILKEIRKFVYMSQRPKVVKPQINLQKLKKTTQPTYVLYLRGLEPQLIKLEFIIYLPKLKVCLGQFFFVKGNKTTNAVVTCKWPK